MRSPDVQTGSMVSYVRREALGPPDHPLRAIRVLVNGAPERLSGEFDKLHAPGGRDSIAPKKLLRWEMAVKLFAAVRADPRVRPLLSSEHVSVDGTLIGCTPKSIDGALMKSFRPKDVSCPPPGQGRNGERDVHGERRSNETHALTTAADARLARKSNGQPSRFCDARHVVMENRHGLAVGATTTRATGTADRDAGEAMMAGLDRAVRSTLGADRNDDTRDFVASMRGMGVPSHATQHCNGRRSAIDGQTTRHAADRAARARPGRMELHAARRRLQLGPVAEDPGHRSMTTPQPRPTISPDARIPRQYLTRPGQHAASPAQFTAACWGSRSCGRRWPCMADPLPRHRALGAARSPGSASPARAGANSTPALLGRIGRRG